MSYTEQLQRIVKKYEVAGHSLPAPGHEIAAWAIEQGLWNHSATPWEPVQQSAGEPLGAEDLGPLVEG